MTEQDKDILAKAIDELKAQDPAAGPPQEVVNKTLTRLAEAAHDAPAAPAPDDRYGAKMLPRIGFLSRWAIAASLLLTAGYAVGRLSSPAGPDVEELRAALLPSLAASLEPAIRQRVVEETTRDYQQAMVAGYLRMKDELTAQYQADLNRLALQTFTASNAVTNNLLRQLVEAVAESQRRDQQRLVAALAEMETTRRQDIAQLDSKIEYTNKKVVRLLANTETDASTYNPEKSSEIK